MIRRLILERLGVPVADCAVCRRPFVAVYGAKACPDCRHTSAWRAGNWRRRQRAAVRTEQRRREREARAAPILRLRSQGLGYKRIASELGLTRDQVRHVVLTAEGRR